MKIIICQKWYRVLFAGFAAIPLWFVLSILVNLVTPILNSAVEPSLLLISWLLVFCVVTIWFSGFEHMIVNARITSIHTASTSLFMRLLHSDGPATGSFDYLHFNVEGHFFCEHDFKIQRPHEFMNGDLVTVTILDGHITHIAHIHIASTKPQDLMKKKGTKKKEQIGYGITGSVCKSSFPILMSASVTRILADLKLLFVAVILFAAAETLNPRDGLGWVLVPFGGLALWRWINNNSKWEPKLTGGRWIALVACVLIVVIGYVLVSYRDLIAVILLRSISSSTQAM